MIYAATWDVTGDVKYEKMYRQYLTDAIKQTQEMKAKEQHAAYVYVQMQCSFELLEKVEQSPEIKRELRDLMEKVSAKATSRAMNSKAALASVDLAMLGPDWRLSKKWINQGEYRNPQWGAYRHVWHVIREAGELGLVPLMMKNATISASQKQRLDDIILQMDYEHCSSCGLIYHLAAYWKMRKQMM